MIICDEEKGWFAEAGSNREALPVHNAALMAAYVVEKLTNNGHFHAYIGP
jgi:hypothetical protein